MKPKIMKMVISALLIWKVLILLSKVVRRLKNARAGTQQSCTISALICIVITRTHYLFIYLSYSSFDYDLVFGTTLGNQSKADRLIYGQSLMTHAMLFTGVTLEDVSTINKPINFFQHFVFVDFCWLLVVDDGWFFPLIIQTVDRLRFGNSANAGPF